MKKINYSIIITLLLFSTEIFSQEIIKPLELLLTDIEHDNPNTYYKDTNNKLQNLTGIWVYNGGLDYLRISITKNKVLYGSKHNIFYDCLTIKFEYKNNGVTKYYNTNPFNVPIGANSKPSELRSAFVKGNVISVVYIEPSFTDCHRRRIGDLKLELVNGTTNQLQWTRTNDERYFYDNPCDNGVPTDNSDFLIPANMILIKQ